MAEHTLPGWRTQIRDRAFVLAGFFAIWTLAIVIRLVYLQVVSHDDLVQRALNQYERKLEAPAKRGDIYDRNGRLLAYSVDADSIYAVPNQIKDKAAVAQQLCGALKGCAAAERAAIVKSLNKTGELRRRLGDPSAGPVKSITRDSHLAANGAGRSRRRSTRAV